MPGAPYSTVENIIRIVTGSPVAVADINTEIATQNAAGYQFTSLEYIDSDTVAVMFSKMPSGYYYDLAQKLNLVTASQAAVDADIATEDANNFLPTGIFISDGGDLLVGYQQTQDPP